MDFACILRTGRAAKELTQEQLADLSGVSAVTISRLEAGNDQPSARTQARILRAFEKQGIRFNEHGFEMTDTPVFFVEGDTHEKAYLQLLEDAHEHLRTVKNPELLIMYADDRVSPPSVNDMYRAMRAEGIRMRQMIEQGNTHILGPLDEYRYVPKGYFINRVKLIYGERIATETSSVLRGIVRVDPINAEIERNSFNMLWSVLDQPTETTADERF